MSGDLTGPSNFGMIGRSFFQGPAMDNWHVDPNTGIMICLLSTGNVLLAVPNRGIVSYGPEEVEHVTIATGIASRSKRRTVAGNQTH